MSRRPRHEPLSPRALARLGAPRDGYVPSLRELEPSGGLDGDGPGSTSSTRTLSRADDGGETARPRRTPTRWFRVPAAFVGARWEPSGRAVLGLALAVAVAVLLFGLRVGWASTEGTVLAPGGGSRAGPAGLSAGSVPVGTGPGATTGAGVPSSSPVASPGASGVTGGVVVHVVGQVRRPGLQRLPPGSRVADAVDAAGGATGRADLARVNLARVLVDGEQVVVPAPGVPDPPGVPAPGTATRPPGSGGGGTVSLNTADLAGLDTLPGVGPVLAQRILDWRSEHGRFTSVDELGEVSGIGEKLLEQLRPRVTL
jgi:competence protein ComEA